MEVFCTLLILGYHCLPKNYTIMQSIILCVYHYYILGIRRMITKQKLASLKRPAVRDGRQACHLKYDSQPPSMLWHWRRQFLFGWLTKSARKVWLFDFGYARLFARVVLIVTTDPQKRLYWSCFFFS